MDKKSEPYRIAFLRMYGRLLQIVKPLMLAPQTPHVIEAKRLLVDAWKYATDQFAYDGELPEGYDEEEDHDPGIDSLLPPSLRDF